ncbi:hypothetical protein PoB_003353100 [Plakobranchus ocellatus]|uniref:C2H2-type domain-containing protein n=1 Tax=Plakobranchus ocellatus TaxID=259542 RepID=A0AAV4AFE2_9GAST|nr:hypothetical protein PoB_003353100 [Plakobranchus ocellatus]
MSEKDGQNKLLMGRNGSVAASHRVSYAPVEYWIYGLAERRSDHLRNHMKSHDLMENDEGYRCPVCQQNYMSASALTNHLKTHKSKSNDRVNDSLAKNSSVDSAETPPKLLKTESLNPFIKLEKFVCDVCSEEFLSQDYLDAHIAQAHRSGDIVKPDQVKCPLCPEGFGTTEDLCAHIVTHASPSGAITHSPLTLTPAGEGKGQQTKPPVPDGGDRATIMRGLLQDEPTNEGKALVSSTSPGPGTLAATSNGTPVTGEALVCPYCLVKGFETLERLELHLTSIHSVKPTEVYTCNYCNAPYPNLYSLHDHMTVVHRSQHGLDITYPCSFCIQRFHSLDALAKHKGIVHAQAKSSGIDAAFCNRCNMTLASPRYLEDHMATVHNIIMDKPSRSAKRKGKKLARKVGGKTKEASGLAGSKTNGSPPGENATPKAKHAKPSESGSVGETAAAMLMGTEHDLSFTTHKISSLLAKGSLSDSPSLMTQLNMSSGLTCDQCNATFHDPQNFAAHLALHSTSLLSLSLARSAAVAAAAAAASAMETTACGGSGGSVDSDAVAEHAEEAGRGFAGDVRNEQDSLARDREEDVGAGGERRGQARTPQGNSNSNNNSNSSNGSTNLTHECVKCGASFSSEEQLEAHASLHYLCVSTEYGCSSCLKNFSKPDELQKHLMDIHAHHLYRCSLCKDIFDSKVNIQVHFAIKHSNECKLYKCLSCEIMFRSEMEWQVHVRVHHLHMSRPYKCLFCQESFTSEVELQCHLTTHSKQFRCPMCDQAFHIEYLLDQHMQSCHGDHKPDLAQKQNDRKSPRPTSLFKNIAVKKEQADSPNPFSDPKFNPFSSKPLSASSSSSSSGSPRIILKSPVARSPSRRSAPSPHNSQSSAASPNPGRSPHAGSVITSPIMHGAAPSVPMTSPPAAASAIWKNTEPLHTCNICDMKFCNLTLLNLHKTQDHGVKPSTTSKSSATSAAMSLPVSTRGLATTNKTVTASVAASVASAADGGHQRQNGKGGSKADREKVLLANQTILSVLTNASPTSQDVNQASAPPLSLITPSPVSTPLSCMFCSQTFKSSSEYNKHMKIHINSGNLTCSICDETFTSPSVLAEHKLTHCIIQQGNTCVVCRVTLNNQEQFFLHAQEHGFDGSLVQCVICRQTLSSLTELQMHGRHHFRSRPTFFTCCVCLKSFESRENLVSKLNASGRTYYVCKPCYHGEAPLHTCSQCSEKFATAHLLEAHEQTHKQATFQCIKCQESFNSEREIQLHVASHVLTEGTHHECRLCGSVLDSPARLQTHLIQHSFVGSDIVCHVCGKMFDSPQEIQVHALEHGAPYRKYACSRCAHKFFFSAELDNHKLIYNHGTFGTQGDAEGDSNTAMNAPVAGMLSLSSKASTSSALPLPPSPLPMSASSLLSSPAALSMATLASYISSASSLGKTPEDGTSATPKNFLDGFSFSPTGFLVPSQTSQNLLNSQLFSKTPASLLSPPGTLFGEPYPLHLSLPLASPSPVSPLPSLSATLQCPDCGKYFSTGTALANHRKTHWKKESNHAIRCSLCAATFPSATAMQEHFFTVHSDSGRGEGDNRKKKSFKCMMCEKECSTLSALQNHILSHRTGGSLPCSLCKRTFTSQRYLNLHMKVHKTQEESQLPKESAAKEQGGNVKGSEVIQSLSPSSAATAAGDKQEVLGCPVCGEMFTSTGEIDEHLKIHEEVFTTTLTEPAQDDADVSMEGEATEADGKDAPAHIS